MVAGVLLCLLCFSSQSFALERVEIKAALLFNFALEVRWPEESGQVITIGLFGEQPGLYKTLKTGLKGKTIRGMPIRVIQTNNPLRLSGPVMLVFDRDQAVQVREWMPKIRGRSFLVVTDNIDDQTLVMINLLDTDSGRISFEMNRPNMLREQLAPQPNILLLGGSELDVVELFRRTERKLLETQLRVDALTNELEQANSDLDAINEKISVRAEALSQKNVELQKAEKVIQQKAQDISQRESAVLELDKKLQVLTRDAEVAKEAASESELVARSALEQAHSSRLERDRTLQSLQQVREEISARQKELVDLSRRLTEETETTKRQQDVINQQLFLLVVVGLALTIGIVSLILLSRNRQLLAQKVEELNEARAQAETASSAKSQFLATMSHEIRTPMNAIIGLAEILRDGHLAGEDKNKAQIIYDSARGLMRILNDILDFSKIEAGKMDIQNEPFDVIATVSDTVQMFRQVARERGVELQVGLDSEVPQRLIGDRQRIQQMLSNLVSNAIKFTAQGQIRVDVAWVESQLILTVTDTGIGMSRTDLDNLFDEFVQVSSQKLRPEGTGLGLAICKRLTDLMGGSISVKSELGGGSRFQIRLPLKVSEGDASLPQIQSGKESLPAMNIWVAEDNPVNQKVIMSLCEKLGQTPVLFDNGQLVYEAYCQDQTADLILMDCEMPVLDGWEATRAIRKFEADKDLARIYIVALTAHAMREFTEACYQAGMNAVMQKPITLDLLRSGLSEACRQDRVH